MFASTFETLESRRLFAAAPPVATVVEAGGVVDVTATKKADDIHVRLNADGVTLEVAHNGVVIGSYAASGVSLVRVDAGKGNDNVHVDANVLVATNLMGGVGNDILVAGGAASTMSGGAGKDSLTGSLFADMMAGDNGSDVMAGLDGNDNMNGGNGKDVLDAGNGDDLVVGGNGRDALTGGAGADNFAGNDKLWEFVDLNGVEDTYTININPWDLIDDIWPF
jgi:Ca2+-binding RTX toxin-like protein